MKKSRWNLALLGSASLLAMAAAPHEVFAQSTAAQPAQTANAPAGSNQRADAAAQPASPSSQPANSNQLAEVVVTAQKREETAQKTPLAVQVVSQDLLDKANVKDITNLYKVAPQVQFINLANSAGIQIRGLRSTSLDFADESPNAVHIDGIYLPNSREITTLFFDTQRIEVLAGPQGTLFGRNAAAGVINIITNKPTFTPSAEATLEAGNFDLINVRAAVNMPINDKLAVRLAGMETQHQGYYTTTGMDDLNMQGGRIHVLFEPDTRQRLLLTGDYEQQEGKGPGFNVVPPDPPQNFTGTTPAFPIAPLRDNSSAYPNYATRASIHNPTWGVAGEYDYHFDPATLTVQASDREVHYNFNTPGLVAISGPQYGQIFGSGYHQSVEGRLTSNETKPVQWVGGLYYFHDKSGGYTATYNANGSLASYLAVPGTTTNAWATFGQATYTPDFLQQLRITAGGRYNSDTKRGNGIVNTTVSPVQTITWDKFTWKVGLEYDVTSRNMIYGNISTGYKAGGFVYGAQPVALPQNITAYEIGSKNRFLDNRLQFNVDAYYYDYQNFEQTYVKLINGLAVLNVTSKGGAHIYGLEFQTDYRVTSDDIVSLSANYLHARFHDLDLTPELATPGLNQNYNYDNRVMPNTPAWTVTGSYAHTFHLGSGDLEASAFGRFVDKRTINPPGNGAPALPGGKPIDIYDHAYTTLDLALKYAPAGGHWTITGYANNIGNTIFYNQAAYQSSPLYPRYLGNITAAISPPRTYGVILNLRY